MNTKCDVCHGEGYVRVSDVDFDRCRRCGGSGKISPKNKDTNESDAIIKLLNEAYVFIGMPHKELHPWRIALDDWKKRVEGKTGWNHFQEAKKFKKETNETP